MGIYVFNARLLEKLLIADAADDESQHDFGKNVIPAAIDMLQVFAYPFTDVKTRAQNYWRDVGTVDAFYEANIELVHVAPELNLYDEEWPIWTYQLHQPPAKFVLDEDRPARHGGQLHGLRRLHHLRRLSSISRCCSPTCASRSVPAIFRSVVLPNVKIGAGCTISSAILDEGCEIPDGMQIGVDRGGRCRALPRHRPRRRARDARHAAQKSRACSHLGHRCVAAQNAFRQGARRAAWSFHVSASLS